jgi:hypothetical protein
MGPVTAIGWRAHAALTTSGGVAKLIAPLSGSLYVEAAGELLWIGPPDAALHGRAILAQEMPQLGDGPSVRAAVDDVVPWRPPPHRLSSARTRDGARALRAALPQIGEPRGLARLLGAGGNDDPVTERARPHARALALAFATDDTAALADAARPLLGLGAGLTPSGDDYVGGLLFVRRLLADAEPPGWNAAVARIVADAAALTNPISTRVLTDLGAGEGWAPLHDLLTALGAEDTTAALAAARAMTVIGHTSGWDLLTGVLGALLGPDALPAPRR